MTYQTKITGQKKNDLKKKPEMVGFNQSFFTIANTLWYNFFRWVVGLDPDLHLWTFIPHNDLLPPVDVTVKRVLKRVGVFDREYGCKWADVLRYSDFLKLVSPQNKLWADLYLSRLGIMGICNSKKIDSKCDICPFQRFCAY